jgi:hypothetical protein
MPPPTIRIERTRYDLCGFGTIPQQQVEGGLGFSAEHQNFAVDHSLCGQFQQRPRHSCKPVREILMVTWLQLDAVTRFPANRTKPAELQLV